MRFISFLIGLAVATMVVFVSGTAVAQSPAPPSPSPTVTPCTPGPVGACLPGNLPTRVPTVILPTPPAPVCPAGSYEANRVCQPLPPVPTTARSLPPLPPCAATNSCPPPIPAATGTPTRALPAPPTVAPTVLSRATSLPPKDQQDPQSAAPSSAGAAAQPGLDRIANASGASPTALPRTGTGTGRDNAANTFWPVIFLISFAMLVAAVATTHWHRRHP